MRTEAFVSSSEACEKCADEECRQRCSLLGLVAERLGSDSSEGRIRLFVVPVDHLSGAESQERAIQFLADEVKSSFEYRRFRGSDHVFLCLQDGCTQLGKELGRTLANGKGTRAIFAGRDLGGAELEWPCPLRVINLQGRYSSALDDLDKVLIASTLMIEKRNRWVCADEFHHPNHWDLDNRINWENIVNHEYQFIFKNIVHFSIDLDSLCVQYPSVEAQCSKCF